MTELLVRISFFSTCSMYAQWNFSFIVIVITSWLLVIQHYFVPIQTFSQEYYLSNCMFPPLASTSWTEMLMPLLLFANEMLLVTHEFDLKYNTNKVRSLSTSLQNITKRKKERKKGSYSLTFLTVSFSLIVSNTYIHTSHVAWNFLDNCCLITFHWTDVLNWWYDINNIVKILGRFITFVAFFFIENLIRTIE